jgi:hypothetical protein
MSKILLVEKWPKKSEKKNAKMNLVLATESKTFLFVDSVASTKYGGFR